ncbi:molybdopterin-dependent oxidoreductase [Gemmobacter straminiformis]|uniref:Molybdopterin-dependent oxidoreductase n=2 Tax=Paragemmobacter straminiformis TaxID=2045119 RepID=A0A842IAW9_9RHOB|nr:molybdopterin-dependent oxidoreductase [Gemmobacter straminiformis]
MDMGFVKVLAAVAALGFSGWSAEAGEPLPAPTGEVVLTVTGQIDRTNAGDAAEFDLAMLQALDPVTVTTSTIWTDGVQEFRGVSLERLMKEVGATGGMIAASALNDYTVQIPMTDAVEGGAVLAFEANGAELSVRDKGPLWVIYPYDSSKDYQSEVVYARSIWQVAKMDIAAE